MNSVQKHYLDFLKQLLATPGPSGEEAVVARLWRDEARSFSDKVEVDVRGNSFALLEGTGPRVLLAGHIDEIGLMLTYIDDEGYLYFQTIGGWDAQVLVGQRVRLSGNQGDVIGVIGKKPIHLIKSDEQDTASKVKDLWIDIGAKTSDEARERVQVGSVGVIDGPPYELPNGRIISRSLDNRIGAFIVLEALRRLSAARPMASVAAVATTDEEISSAGAMVATFSFDPHVALVVDVTTATDHPNSNKKEDGDVKLGGGPVLSRGAANSLLVYQRLREVAEREGIAYSVQVTPRSTGTDADVIHMARRGVATAIISIPNRYMHTPNEMVDMADVEGAIQLIAAFVRSLRTETEFVYQA
jgi:endoglucanase